MWATLHWIYRQGIGPAFLELSASCPEFTTSSAFKKNCPHILFGAWLTSRPSSRLTTLETFF